MYGGTRFRRKFQLPWNCDTIIREAKHRLYFIDISATKQLTASKEITLIYVVYSPFILFLKSIDLVKIVKIKIKLGMGSR